MARQQSRLRRCRASRDARGLKQLHAEEIATLKVSRVARRAWIETRDSRRRTSWPRRASRDARGLKPLGDDANIDITGRASRDARGLKRLDVAPVAVRILSRVARRAWIETCAWSKAQTNTFESRVARRAWIETSRAGGTRARSRCRASRDARGLKRHRMR